MGLYLSAAISGIAVGLLYGMIGFAIVMLYKSTGVANFAQGTLATLGAFVAWALVTDAGVPLLAAIPIALAASALIGVVIYFLVIRPRAEAGNLNITVRTLGLSLLLLAIMEWRWGALAPYRYPTVVSGDGITIAQVVLPAQTLLTAAVGSVIMVLLWALFKYTNAGLARRRDLGGERGARHRRRHPARAARVPRAGDDGLLPPLHVHRHRARRPDEPSGRPARQRDRRHHLERHDRRLQPRGGRARRV